MLLSATGVQRNKHFIFGSLSLCSWAFLSSTRWACRQYRTVWTNYVSGTYIKPIPNIQFIAFEMKKSDRERVKSNDRDWDIRQSIFLLLGTRLFMESYQASLPSLSHMYNIIRPSFLVWIQTQNPAAKIRLLTLSIFGPFIFRLMTVVRDKVKRQSRWPKNFPIKALE